jgi:hypothetical protein
MMGLSILDFFSIIHRLIVIFIPNRRFHLLRNVAYYCPEKLLREILKECNYGDWFLLYQLAQVVDGPAFHEVLEHMAQSLRESKANV